MVHANSRPAGWLALIAIGVASSVSSWAFGQEPAAPKPAAPAAAATATPAAPGKFKEDAVDPQINEKVEKELIGKRKQVFTKPELWPSVKEYYLRAILPRMTQVNALDQLAASRGEFMRDIDKAVPPLRSEVLQLAYQWAGKVAMDVQYHPAVRINATFILAELEETKLVSSGANPTPPTPYEPSLAALAAIVSDAKSNDGMRVAAIYGLSRYIKLSANSQGRQNAAIKLMSVVSEACPSNRDRKAHAWMQAMALEGMMQHEGLRGNKNVVQQVLKIAANVNEPALLRVKAAEIIGAKLSKPKDLTPPIADLEKSYKTLIAEIFEHEAARLEALNKKPIQAAAGAAGAYAGYGGETGYGMESGYGGSGYSMDSMGSGGLESYGMPMAAAASVPQEPDVIMSRRRVNWLLEGLHTSWDGRKLGTTGAGAKSGLVAWVANGPEKGQIELAIALLSGLQTEMNDTKITKAADYAAKLREKAALLVGAPVPAAAAEPAAAPAAQPAPLDAPSGPVPPGPVPPTAPPANANTVALPAAATGP